MLRNEMSRINVTKTFLPPIEEYQDYLKQIWENGQVTNQGPLLKKFEKNVKKYLGVENFHFVSNGTVALQIALRALGIEEGEVITTPFSYVATTSSILWEKCVPVYVDIDPVSLCIDAGKIESAITKQTKAILAVHVFGNPCNIEKIEEIANKHNLKVIYDGAHAFGVEYKGKSLLDYGDISTCSFHATKIFHTIEGGAIIAREKEVSNKIELMKRFGHFGDEHFMLGINAKASEFQAAMGLCNLKYINEIIEKRKEIFDWYNKILDHRLNVPTNQTDTKYNYSYYYVILKTEKQVTDLVATLNEIDVYPRRYFYPSLNTLNYLSVRNNCPISEDISTRILCLPLYEKLQYNEIEKISQLVNRAIE